MPQRHDWFLFRAQKPLAIFGGVYVLVMLSLCLPALQRHVLYLHALKFPLFTKFDNPEVYGMAPGRMIPITITSSSDITLGAWFTLAESYYHNDLKSSSSQFGPYTIASSKNWQKPTPNISYALTHYPTILMFHGNAATRALPFRVNVQRQFSNYLRSNVLMIDYRGFGDSEGVPSQRGLVDDAHAAWGWLIKNGARDGDVSVLGSSLGTAVGVQLCKELVEVDQKPRALILISPFSSIIKLLETYNLFGLFPLARPLMSIPFAFNLLDKALVDRWDTKAIVNEVPSPIIIVHAKDDYEIPFSHSEDLFKTRARLSSIDISETESTGLSNKSRDTSVHGIAIERLGTIKVAEDIGESGKSRRTVLLITDHGGHNRINGYEGVMEVVRREIGTELL